MPVNTDKTTVYVKLPNDTLDRGAEARWVLRKESQSDTLRALIEQALDFPILRLLQQQALLLGGSGSSKKGRVMSGPSRVTMLT